MAVNKKVTPKVVLKSPVKPNYHFFDCDMNVILEGTEEEFLEDCRSNGDSSNETYYRLPVGLIEKIKVESKVVKA
jgi:hypothetical protein